ncbi:hypothetical protein H7T43_14850 [Peribacillus simplex]|nr:hypothetical protein [Peribacillus simplex]
MKKRAVSKYNHDWSKFERCLQALAFRNGLTQHVFKKKTCLSFIFFPVILNGWKKYATLLPKNWLAETPETLASRRLGRQSAERERISGINWHVF